MAPQNLSKNKFDIKVLFIFKFPNKHAERNYDILLHEGYVYALPLFVQWALQYACQDIDIPFFYLC